MKKERKKVDTTLKSIKSEFKRILERANKIYNYEDESKDSSNKNKKLKYLHKFLERIVESDRQFIDHILRPKIEQIIEMIEKNLFRPLPNKKGTDLDITEGNAEIEEVSDKSWPTLEVIYEILLHIVKHPAIPESILKYFITEGFIQNLLNLFESENAQERDYLKQITHKLYSKVVKRRRMFRKMFNNHFITLIYERPTSHGANEILDIYAAIISGFAVPLKPEHIEFFKQFLTPLLKIQN